MALLECKNLTKVYHTEPALNQINLTIEPGKIIGLLGPNGSGKTTFIKLANGLLCPTSGQILINGLPPGIESKKIISYLPDKTYLSEWMKIQDVLNFFADFYSDFDKNQALNMLHDLNLSANTKLKTLSKGNKEKVQLVLVMARKAQLYLLDEPIGGVDPAAREYILNTIIANYNKDASLIISTHLIQDIESILDDIIFINKGELVLHSSADQIRAEKGQSIDALFREVFKC